MIEAAIFDIDDTLSDWVTSIDTALDKLRLDGDPLSVVVRERFRSALVEYCHTVRDGVVVDRRYWLLLLDPAPPLKAAIQDGDSKFVDALALEFRSLLQPVAYPDAGPALERLVSRYHLGVLTNNPQPERTLQGLGLRRYFRAAVFPGEEHRKPAVEAFLAGCAALKKRPAHCAYVGDSISHDVEGSRRAGLRAVWLDRHGDRYTPPAGVPRIASLGELPAALEALSAG